jgi:hypothetical protein
VDISHGRIRALRYGRITRQRARYHEEEMRAERMDIEHDLLVLRERQQRTMRGLLMLRLDQFRLRHERMLSMLQFLQDQNLREDDSEEGSLVELRSFFSDVSQEMIGAMRRVIAHQREGTSEAEALNQLLNLIRMYVSSEQDDNEESSASAAQIQSIQRRAYVDVPESSEADDNCSICRNLFEDGEEQGALECNHWHCLECLQQWLQVKNACPVCRMAIA